MTMENRNERAGDEGSGKLVLDAITQGLLANSSDCIKLIDTNGRILMMSEGGQCVMEVDDYARQVEGVEWLSYWEPADRQVVKSAFQSALRGETSRFQAFCKTARGTPKWWDVTLSGILGGNGNVSTILSVSRDITDQKAFERELQEREAKLQAILDALPVCVKIVSTGGELLDINPAGRAMLGAPNDMPLSGEQILDFIDEQDRDVFLCAHQAASEGQVSVTTARFGIKGLDGTRRRLASESHPLRDAAGHVWAVVSVSRDVTHEEQAELNLRESEALAQDRLAEVEQIYRYAPVGLFTLDCSYRFTKINEQMAEINGRSAEDHMGASIWEVVPNLAEGLVDLYRPVIDKGEAVTNIDITGETSAAPGVHRNWLASFFPLFSSSGEVSGLIGAVLEVTERKLAEDRLKASEEILAQAIAVAELGVFEVDYANSTVFWSDALKDMVGLGRDEEPTLDTYYKYVHVDDRSVFIEELRAANNPSGDGRYSSQHRVVRADGEIRWLSLAARVQFAANGTESQVVRLIGAAQDITEARQAADELKKAQINLLQVSRLSAMGAMATTLAHELNQPLAAVSNYLAAAQLQLARGEACDSGAVEAAVADGLAATLRAGEIIRRIRGFAIDGRVRLKMREVAPLIEAAWKEVAVLPSAENVAVEIKVPASRTVAPVDAIQIEQVLVNLFRNAVEAMAGREGATVSVTLMQTEVSVEIEVADNGPGLPAERSEDPFIPFRTTKQNGMGLGLPMCRMIIEAHGGSIKAAPNASGGASFLITLPRSKDQGPD
jgi:PAS domain S-box-containing protein